MRHIMQVHIMEHRDNEGKPMDRKDCTTKIGLEVDYSCFLTRKQMRERHQMEISHKEHKQLTDYARTHAVLGKDIKMETDAEYTN